MSSDNNNSNKDFVEEVKRLRNTRLGQKDVVPILGNGAKKPPAWFNWTEFRDGKKPRLTDSELETVFACYSSAISLRYLFLISIR